MKKHYITPAIKDINIIVTQSPLAGSIQGGLGGNTGTQLANGRRGSWGNLWSDDTEE